MNIILDNIPQGQKVKSIKFEIEFENSLENGLENNIEAEHGVKHVQTCSPAAEPAQSTSVVHVPDIQIDGRENKQVPAEMLNADF